MISRKKVRKGVQRIKFQVNPSEFPYGVEKVDKIIFSGSINNWEEKLLVFKKNKTNFKLLS